MAQHKYIAAMYILLVMSMHPVQAFRSRQNVETFGKFAEGQGLMEELQKALHEETQGQDAEEEYPGEWFGMVSCEQRKRDFERRVEKTEKRYETAMADGKLDVIESAWVTLKVRTVAKTLAKGERDKCDWVKDKSVDKSGLERVTRETAGKSKCFKAAQAYLENAAKGTAEEQGRALRDAMSIYLSEDCKVREVPENAGAELDERSEEIDADDEAELLKDAATDAENKRSSALMETLRLHGDELLKAEGISPAEVSALLQKGNSTGSSTESALLEQAENLLSGNPFAEAIAKFFGFIFLCILWVIFCYVIMAVAMIILGLIMCIIKIIIVAVLRVFGSSKWDFDYLGCVGWWARSLGHGGHSASFGIAMCAADMMRR